MRADRGDLSLARMSCEACVYQASSSTGQYDPDCRVQDALSARSNAGTGSSISRIWGNEPRRLKLATKKQKARAAGAGTNLPAKAKPKKKTSRGK
jgi:hypothetical protein